MSDPKNGEPAVPMAFLVVQDKDGDWFAVPEVTVLSTERRATVADMRAGCSEVIADIDASKVAHIVLREMQDAASHLREEIEAATLTSRLRN